MGDEKKEYQITKIFADGTTYININNFKKNRKVIKILFRKSSSSISEWRII
jgi:hypothetical protein